MHIIYIYIMHIWNADQGTVVCDIYLVHNNEKYRHSN